MDPEETGKAFATMDLLASGMISWTSRQFEGNIVKAIYHFLRKYHPETLLAEEPNGKRRKKENALKTLDLLHAQSTFIR